MILFTYLKEMIQTKNNTYVILGIIKNYNLNKKNHILFHKLQYAYMILKIRLIKLLQYE